MHKEEYNKYPDKRSSKAPASQETSALIGIIFSRLVSSSTMSNKSVNGTPNRTGKSNSRLSVEFP